MARTKKFNGLIYHADSSWKFKREAEARKRSLKVGRPHTGKVPSVRMTREPRVGGGVSYKLWVRG